MRGNLEASEYKHVALGLVFLKYISDAFEQRHAYLTEATADPDSDYFLPDPARRDTIVESRDEYTSEAVFWVPPEARWPFLQASAKQPEIGTLMMLRSRARYTISRPSLRHRGKVPPSADSCAFPPPPASEMT